MLTTLQSLLTYPAPVDWSQKNLGNPPQHQAVKLQAFLDPFYIPDFDLNATLHYAEIRADLEAAGKSIGPLDLLTPPRPAASGPPSSWATLPSSKGSKA